MAWEVPMQSHAFWDCKVPSPGENPMPITLGRRERWAYRMRLRVRLVCGGAVFSQYELICIGRCKMSSGHVYHILGKDAMWSNVRVTRIMGFGRKVFVNWTHWEYGGWLEVMLSSSA